MHMNMTDAKQPIFCLTYIGFTIAFTVLQVSKLYFLKKHALNSYISQLNQTFFTLVLAVVWLVS